jgi:hypothetical protein
MMSRTVSIAQDPKANANGLLPSAAGMTRARDVDELCQQFIEVCQSAVDPMEISSALEFDGLSDQIARQRYGARDVFALADEMYRRVPRRPAEPPPSADPWKNSKLRAALHGLLYGLPTVCFPAAAGLLSGSHVLRALVVALLTSWALSQALAYLGYVRLGRAGSAAAARLLLVGMTVTVAGVALALAMAGLVAHARVTGLIFGFGLGAYMLGATVLLVLGAEGLLLVVLAPGVLGSAAFLLLGRPAGLEHAAWATLAATPLLALGLATVRACREAGIPGPRGLRDRLDRRGERGLGLLRRRSRLPGQPGPAADRLAVLSQLREALPSAGFGLVAAGLLVFPVAVGLPGHHGVNTGAVLASLPLALSMGMAEWSLIWFRRRTQRLLRNTQSLPAFTRRARVVLFGALAQYLMAAALLIAAVVSVASATRLVQPHWAVLPEVSAYLALGGAMFLALLLQAFGSRAFPLLACAVALALEILWRDLGVLGQIVACVELLVVLAGYATLTLGRAVRHAF